MTEPRPRTALRVFSLAVFPALLLHGMVLGSAPPIDKLAPPAGGGAPIRVRAVLPATEPDKPVISDIGRQETSSPAQPPQKKKVRAAALVDQLPEAAQPTFDHFPAAPVATASQVDSTAEAAPQVDEEAVILLAQAGDRAIPMARQDGLPAVDGTAIPVYPTAFAPSQLLRYHLQRGLLSGTGELTWRRDPPSNPDAKYELQLKASVAKLTILTQISSGGFDRSGLAPLRFTDQRLRGSVRATNFQRQRSLISFSGPSVEFPLVRGVQDRLSWMIQLPAILAANAKLASPGEEVTLYVVGARGDASIWVFRAVVRESVSTDAGPVDALKFVREPRKPHDTMAEVWLDPSRQFLPVRARIGNPDDGAMLELLRMQD